jgi:hypothetical protein
MARSSSRSIKVYPSRVDAWFIAVIGLSMTAAIVGLVFAAMEDGPLRMLQGLFILLGVIGLLVWILVSTNYTLGGDELLIRSGPFSWRIPIAQITSVDAAGRQSLLFRTRSSPALSLDRINLTYGNGKRIMISPADKAKFLADLKARQASPA